MALATRVYEEASKAKQSSEATDTNNTDSNVKDADFEEK